MLNMLGMSDASDAVVQGLSALDSVDMAAVMEGDLSSLAKAAPGLLGAVGLDNAAATMSQGIKI